MMEHRVMFQFRTRRKSVVYVSTSANNKQFYRKKFLSKTLPKSSRLVVRVIKPDTEHG